MAYVQDLHCGCDFQELWPKGCHVVTVTRVTAGGEGSCQAEEEGLSELIRHLGTCQRLQVTDTEVVRITAALVVA